jgi:hypothetical protein
LFQASAAAKQRTPLKLETGLFAALGAPLLQPRPELATPERDRIIAGYQLIASVGRITAAISISTWCPTIPRKTIAGGAAASSGQVSETVD